MTNQITNLIIDALPSGVRAKMNLLGEMVELEVDSLLSEQGTEIRFVYFPLTCFVSMLASVDKRPAMELGLVGREGFFGASLLTGVNTAPLKAVVRGAGSALRIDAGGFLSELQKSAPLRLVVGRYLHSMITNVASTAACSHFHTAGTRLARLLLETDDRTLTDSFVLTHKVLAHMLGVRRSAVSIAANILQQQNTISYSRGRIKIIDRTALEAESCSCYMQGKVSRESYR